MRTLFNLVLLFLTVLTVATEVVVAEGDSSDRLELKPLDLNDPAQSIKLLGRGNSTFVVHAMIFVDSVALHESCGDHDREILNDALQQLEKIHESMPLFQELFGSKLDAQLIARRAELKAKHGWVEGIRLFSDEQIRRQLELGNVVKVDQQQQRVWKIIDSLDGMISDFDQFKSGLLLSILGTSGPVAFFDDVYVRSQLGLDDEQYRAFIVSAGESFQTYETELRQSKHEAVSTTWNELTDFQKNRLCRLLGKTEHAFLTTYEELPKARVLRDLRGDVQFEFENISASRLNQFWVEEPLKMFQYRRKQQFTDAELKLLSGKLERLLENSPVCFVNEQIHEQWFRRQQQRFDPLIRYLEEDERPDGKAASKNLKSLRKKVSIYHQCPAVESMRSDIPMIYFLHEFDKLDDSPYHGTWYQMYEGQGIAGDNYLPFIQNNPYPGENVSKDALVDQFAATEELRQRWAFARSKAKSYSDLIAINNDFLRQTKETMLPFQYGATFEQFFWRRGLVAFFKHWEVAEDFRMSDLQRKHLSAEGIKSAMRFEIRFDAIRRNAVESVYSKMNAAQNRKLENALGIDHETLITLTLEAFDEQRFTKALATSASDKHFSGIRMYEHPYSTGMRY